MALRPVHVNVKAVDSAAVGRFWAAALGWPVHSPGVTTYTGPAGGSVWPEPVGLGICVVPVPDAKPPTKNRTHLDLATTSPAHHAAVVERLLALGATRADIGQGEVPWTVLADVEGNEFCVREPRTADRDTGPIAAVVLDSTDPRAAAHFWGEATEWTVHALDDDRATLRAPEGTGPVLEFRRVHGPPVGPGRLHLDLLPGPGDDKAQEVARVAALGASALDLGQGAVPWTCLTDPEGHEFCVLAHH
ncbi:VOC family protein [Kitasatospora albolonga]|uniref:VOC family protein n=1 Tax=Kitasatospora albolonga TaxID=68173 RepID=UPI0031ED6CA7